MFAISKHPQRFCFFDMGQSRFWTLVGRHIRQRVQTGLDGQEELTRLKRPEELEGLSRDVGPSTSLTRESSWLCMEGAVILDKRFC